MYVQRVNQGQQRNMKNRIGLGSGKEPREQRLVDFKIQQKSSWKNNVMVYRRKELDKDELIMRSAFIDFSYDNLKRMSVLNKAKIRTFFRSVQLYDSYVYNLDIEGIDQLGLGLACIWVASKLEDIECLRYKEILQMGQNTLEIEQILEYEKRVVELGVWKTLEIDLVQKYLEMIVDDYYVLSDLLLSTINVLKKLVFDGRWVKVGSKKLVGGLVCYLIRMRMFGLGEEQLRLEMSRKIMQMGLKVLEVFEDEQIIREMVQMYDQKQNGVIDIANIMYY